jgi:hypothetical protein
MLRQECGLRTGQHYSEQQPFAIFFSTFAKHAQKCSFRGIRIAIHHYAKISVS